MTRKLGLLAAISVFVTIVLAAPGCNSGCIDKFDCGSGSWQCVNSACVAGAPDAG
jgi:hypothetical protein